MGVLARHMAKPSIEHLTAAMAVRRYIAGTLGCGITFRRTDTAVGGYSDADHAGDSDNRTSTTDLSSCEVEELSVRTADCSLQRQPESQKQSTWPQLRQSGRHSGSRKCWVTLASRQELCPSTQTATQATEAHQ